MSVVFLTGCATNSATAFHRVSATPSEEIRARLGTVRVESAGKATQVEFAKPLTPGEAAAKGAFESSMDLLGGAAGSGPMGGMVAVAVMPLAAAVGGASGASKGTPEAEIQATENALLWAFSRMDCERAVREKVVQLGSRNTRHPFVTGSAGADSVLQLDVAGAGLAGSTEKGAPLTMFLRVKVRLRDTRNGKVLYEQNFVQTSGSHTFKQWGANGGRLFRDQLPVLGGIIAENIIDEIFLTYRPSKWRQPHASHV